MTSSLQLSHAATGHGTGRIQQQNRIQRHCNAIRVAPTTTTTKIRRLTEYVYTAVLCIWVLSLVLSQIRLRKYMYSRVANGTEVNASRTILFAAKVELPVVNSAH